MNFFKRLIFILSLMAISNVFADECKNFEEKVLSIPPPVDGIVTDGQQERKDLGLFFHQEYSFQENKFKIKRNKDNFPILKISFVNNKLPHDSSIVSINGNDLSKLLDHEINKLISASSATVNTKNNSYQINSENYDLYPFDLEYFTINAIDEIQTKEGEFKLDYSFQVSHERPDWINAGREIGNLTVCPIGELTESTQIYSPVTNETVFLKQVGYDQDKSFASYDQIYFSKFDKTYSRTTMEGVATIKSDFDLRTFPFDTQILKLELSPPYPIDYNEENNYPKPYISILNAKKNVFLELDKYKKSNYLKEWTVIDIGVENKLDITKSVSAFNRDKLTNTIYDTIFINIIVERNTNYFIFKIIIPVFLILSIAWSVMWIPPNQIESRLTTSIVALLALIAYNFVFNEDLPKLSYLTSLDRYILLSYLFCAIPTFLTIYFSRITKKDYKISLEINKKSRLLGVIIYLISATVIFST